MPTSTDCERRAVVHYAMGVTHPGEENGCRPALAVMLALTCTLFAACGASKDHESVSSPRLQLHAASVAPITSGSVATLRSGEQGRSIHEKCGETTVLLQCSGTDCLRTSLQMTTADGQTLHIANPAGLESYSAVGLGCAVASDQTPYLVVQYGELPTGCGFCEWFHVLDAKGQWLTQSVPAILTDRTLPVAHDQTPNNRDFNAFSRKWKLGNPHITFIQ